MVDIVSKIADEVVKEAMVKFIETMGADVTQSVYEMLLVFPSFQSSVGRISVCHTAPDKGEKKKRKKRGENRREKHYKPYTMEELVDIHKNYIPKSKGIGGKMNSAHSIEMLAKKHLRKKSAIKGVWHKLKRAGFNPDKALQQKEIDAIVDGLLL